MKKAVVVFGVVAALFMLTGCPKEKVVKTKSNKSLV